jgi:hypothetical protein
LDGNPRIYGASVDIGAYEFRPAVVARRTFYNNSYFDGDDPAANAADDDAIAPDKVALLPGQTATFANCTTYSRGINGIMVDIAGLADPAGLTPATLGSYFTFRVGNDNDPDAWSLAPTPSAVLVRLGAGEGGGDRIEIIWADNAIQAQWLQVTVLADAHGGRAGLADDDVFYFGTLPGDATGDGVVGVADYLTVKWQYGTTVPLPGSKADFDCSGDVGRGDLAAVGPRFGQSINLAFSPPAVVVAAEATAPAAPDPAPAEPGEPGAPAEPAGPAEPAEPTVEPAPADPAPAGPAEATAPEGATVPAAETPAMEGPGAFVEPVTPSAETAEPIRLPAPSEEAPNADVLAAATGILGTPPVSDPQNVAVAPAPEAITPLAADVLWCLPATSLPQPGAADALAVLTPGALPQRSASPADAWAALSLPPIRFTGPLRSASASWLSTRQGDAPRRWAGDALQQAAAVRSDDATAQSAGTETWATTLAARITNHPRKGRPALIALDILAIRK